LKEKGLYDHLTSGKTSEASSASRWDQEDNQIIYVMPNSVEPHIGSSCIYLPIAKDIWDHLSHMYSGAGNITRIYEVCKQYFGLEQGAQTVDEYYNKVVAICKERNMYQPLSIDLKKMEKQRQDADVVRFLLGLKPEYESIHAQILGGSDLPSLPKVFSRIQRATLSDHGLQMNYEHHGEHANFIVARATLVVLVIFVVFVAVMVFVVDVILEDVVGLEDVGLTSALIVAALIILWITVFGIYIAHHLHLPAKFLLMRIL
jgi:hypothetical protein